MKTVWNCSGDTLPLSDRTANTAVKISVTIDLTSISFARFLIIMVFTLQIFKPVVYNLDLFVDNRNFLGELIMLVNFLFKLFNTVTCHFGRYKYTTKTSGKCSDK